MLNKLTTRLLAFVLAFMMAVSYAPAAVFAQTDADADVVVVADSEQEEEAAPEEEEIEEEQEEIKEDEKDVEDGEEQDEEVEFSQTAEVDGFTIKVTADKGVFPKGAILNVRKATTSEEETALKAMDETVDSDNAEVSYFFDISIVDEDGNDIQPDTSKGEVKVSFTSSDVADYDISVYNIHEGSLNELDVEEKDDETAVVSPDGFCTFIIFGWYPCVKPCPTPTPTPCPTPTPTPTPEPEPQPQPCPKYTATVTMDGWTYGDDDAPNQPDCVTDAPNAKISYKFYDSVDPLVEHEGDFTRLTEAGTYYVQAIVTYCGGIIKSDIVPFVITKKSLKLDIKDKTINYGDPAPDVEATYSGLEDEDKDADKPKEGVLDEDPVFTIKDAQGNPYEVGSPVGDYDINVEKAVTAKNYEVTVDPGTLTVVAKKITAEASLIWYDEADNKITSPFNSYVYNGKVRSVRAAIDPAVLVNDDVVDVVYDGVREAKDHSDKAYVVSVTGLSGDKASNYEFDATAPEATMEWTIAKTDLTVTAKDKTILYGSKPSNNGVSYAGFVGDDDEKSLKGSLDYSYTYEKNQKPGKYKIMVTGLISDNYNISYKDGVLTVLENNKEVVAKAELKGKKSLLLSWQKVTGAERYVVYMAKCGSKKAPTKLKKYKTLDSKHTSMSFKKLNKKYIYKFQVYAQKKINGKWKTVGKSRVVHIVPSKKNKTYTNQKSLKVKKTVITLKPGQTYRIKATYKKVNKKKKILTRGHADPIRYKSTNKKVATVSKKGLVRAKGTGYCKIYPQLIKGDWKTVEVTVIVKD
jgi:hypothetical protein